MTNQHEAQLDRIHELIILKCYREAQKDVLEISQNTNGEIPNHVWRLIQNLSEVLEVLAKKETILNRKMEQLMDITGERNALRELWEFLIDNKV